jgi:hypothetical protein
MSDLASFASGLCVGLFLASVLALEWLADRRAFEQTRLAAALRTERLTRCALGQHREVVWTKTPYLHVSCLDCSWTEELGVAYLTGSNRRTRRRA